MEHVWSNSKDGSVIGPCEILNEGIALLHRQNFAHAARSAIKCKGHRQPSIYTVSTQETNLNARVLKAPRYDEGQGTPRKQGRAKVGGHGAATCPWRRRQQPSVSPFAPARCAPRARWTSEALANPRPSLRRDVELPWPRRQKRPVAQRNRPLL